MAKADALRAKAAKELFRDILNGDLDQAKFGPGTDYFRATSAADNFNGGAGIDSVDYSTATTGVGVGLNANGLGFASGGAAGDTLRFIENVVGSAFADTLLGDAGNNVIYGGGGNDTIHGNGGSDMLFGDAGRDTITSSGSGGSRAYMDGGSEADTLKFFTGGGNATIKTGTGNDLTVISITDNQDFRVVIKDFQPYFEAFGQVVTSTESLRGDQLKIEFNSSLGTNLNALGAFEQIVSGDDLTLRFTNRNVNGDIVLEDIGQWLDLAGTQNGFTFNVDFAFRPPTPIYEAV